jgi:hypothetical protein
LRDLRTMSKLAKDLPKTTWCQMLQKLVPA